MDIELPRTIMPITVEKYRIEKTGEYKITEKNGKRKLVEKKRKVKYTEEIEICDNVVVLRGGHVQSGKTREMLRVAIGKIL